MTRTLDRIRESLIGLRIPRALEALDHVLRRLERGEITAIEAVESLLAEEFASRETRRVGVALKTARLTPPKMLQSFGFSFQLSLDRGRLHALAQLDFGAPRSCTSSAHPAPGNPSSPPPSASPP